MSLLQLALRKVPESYRVSIPEVAMAYVGAYYARHLRIEGRWGTLPLAFSNLLRATGGNVLEGSAAWRRNMINSSLLTEPLPAIPPPSSGVRNSIL